MHTCAHIFNEKIRNALDRETRPLRTAYYNLKGLLPSLHKLKCISQSADSALVAHLQPALDQTAGSFGTERGAVSIQVDEDIGCITTLR
jgi:hypothetical protein